MGSVVTFILLEMQFFYKLFQYRLIGMEAATPGGTARAEDPGPNEGEGSG